MRLLCIGMVLSLVLLSGCAGTTVHSSGQVPSELLNPTIALASDDALSEALTGELMGCGFKIIERSRLTNILREHSLSLSGLLEKENAEKIGKILNVDLLVYLNVVTARRLSDRVQSASVKMVDIRNAQVVVAVNYSNGSGLAAGALSDAMMKEKMPDTARSIARELAVKFGKKCQGQP